MVARASSRGCGDYRAVVESNHAAIEADRKFLAREGAGDFYSLYRCHDYHFKIYGAMFLGRFRPAIAALEEMITTLPERDETNGFHLCARFTVGGRARLQRRQHGRNVTYDAPLWSGDHQELVVFVCL